MKFIVKLTTPWNHNLLSKTPNGLGVFGDYKFEIDNDCSVCDYWIVWGNLKNRSKVKCPPENVIYLADETHSERKFNQDFINQFPSIIACRRDIQHPRVIITHDLGVWHFNQNYDEVTSGAIYEKRKEISSVSSDLTWLPGHKKRFAFVNQLMGHFTERIDFYGRGINPIEDKLQALSPYKYSVAIENNYTEGYFTEKLYECFLTNTLPIYYGCPDLEKYFDPRAFVRIDIANYRNAFQIITELLDEDIYNERLPYLLESRRLYMEKYFVFPALTEILGKNFSSKRQGISNVVLNTEQSYSDSLLGNFYAKTKKYFS